MSRLDAVRLCPYRHGRPRFLVRLSRCAARHAVLDQRAYLGHCRRAPRERDLAPRFAVERLTHWDRLPPYDGGMAASGGGVRVAYPTLDRPRARCEQSCLAGAATRGFAHPIVRVRNHGLSGRFLAPQTGTPHEIPVRGLEKRSARTRSFAWWATRCTTRAHCMCTR